MPEAKNLGKGNAEKENRKRGAEGGRKYLIWDNYHYMFQALERQEGMGAFAVCIGDTVLSILLPFLETALAGAVAACLVSGRGAGEILLLAAAYVLFLQVVRFLQGHFRSLRRKILFMFRIDVGNEFDRKTLEIDGQCLESAAGRKKWEAARRNLYMGNGLGIEAYAHSFWDMLIHFGGLVLYGGIVGNASPVLLSILVAQTLLVAVLDTFVGKRAYGMEDEIEDKWKGFRYLRRESIVPGNGKDIRLYRMDKWFLGVFHDMIDRICVLIDRQQTGYMAAKIADILLSFGRSVAVYGWLLWEMASGRMTLPVFLLCVGVAAGFEGWMNGLFSALQQVWQNTKLMDAYRDFMDYGIVEEGKPTPVHGGCVHEIRLENVSFRYEGNEEDTIQHLSLTIRAGEKLALVGLNGAGKTTLIKLLCGLYRPTGGKIYLDGQDLQSLSQREVFKEFAVVFQDVFAFSFPLLENVSCVREGQEDGDKLRESLKTAGLWERVQTLPEKEKTSMNKDLDKEGVGLSGGELQKLMLARALYKDAPVVILDEPTAALDPIAESEMYEKYNGMIRDKTAVFISHRLSSTRFCDRILFMENGRIVEEGSHKELMKADGAYAALFTLQARYYQEKKIKTRTGEAYEEINCNP